MRHPGPVRGRQGPGHRGDHLERLPGRQRPLRQPLLQGLPADQIPDQVGQGDALRQRGFAVLAHRDDPRAGQLDHRACDEAEPGLGHRIPGRVRIEHLDRDVMAGHPVGRPPYLALTPGPDWLYQPEPAPEDRCLP